MGIKGSEIIFINGVQTVITGMRPSQDMSLATVRLADAAVPGGYRVSNQSDYSQAALAALVAGGATLAPAQ